MSTNGNVKIKDEGEKINIFNKGGGGGGVNWCSTSTVKCFLSASPDPEEKASTMLVCDGGFWVK